MGEGQHQICAFYKISLATAACKQAMGLRRQSGAPGLLSPPPFPLGTNTLKYEAPFPGAKLPFLSGFWVPSSKVG